MASIEMTNWNISASEEVGLNPTCHCYQLILITKPESDASSTAFYIPQDSELPPNGPRPDQLRTTVNGRTVNVRRLPTSEADDVLRRRGNDNEEHDRAPINERGLSYSGDEGHSQHFGMQDGIPPLQELGPHETSQTEKEREEIHQREHESQQEYYNQYRNPIARLRAQYPQAPAEFLAVRTKP